MIPAASKGEDIAFFHPHVVRNLITRNLFPFIEAVSGYTIDDVESALQYTYKILDELGVVLRYEDTMCLINHSGYILLHTHIFGRGCSIKIRRQ